MNKPKTWLTTVLSAGLLLSLAACSPTALKPDPVADVLSPVESNPVLNLEGSAEDNIGFFTKTVQDFVTVNTVTTPQAIGGALVTAGFDKVSIEVSQETTMIGDTPRSSWFAVLINGSCLVGQYGPDSALTTRATDPATVLSVAVPTDPAASPKPKSGNPDYATVAGRCLIGASETVK